MKKSKLVKLLEALDRNDLDRFRDFVRSPFFNKKPSSVKLLDYLFGHFPAFSEEALEKRKVFQILFPEEPYEDKKIRYQMSYLTKLLEDFLAIEVYQRQTFLNNYYLLKNLNERKLDTHFEIEYKRLSKHMSENPERNADYYYQLHQLSTLADQHFLQKRERKFDINIQNACHHLDHFYLSKKIRFRCNMADRQKFLATEYQVDFQPELQSMLTGLNYEGLQDIELYNKVYRVIEKDADESEFSEIITQLNAFTEVLSENDQKEIFIYLINYCARKIRQGNESFVETALGIYLKGLETQVLFEDGYVSPWTFKNIVSLGLRSKQFGWVESFIRKYSESIKSEFRQDAMHFNLADLSFHQNQFNQTLSHLNELKYSDIYYNLNGRVLLLKTYYHLDEISPLLSGISSFTIYLKRNKKITKEVKKSYLNFCSLLFQIIKSKAYKRQTLHQKISNTKQVISKAWLSSVCLEDSKA